MCSSASPPAFVISLTLKLLIFELVHPADEETPPIRRAEEPTALWSYGPKPLPGRHARQVDAQFAAISAGGDRLSPAAPSPSALLHTSPLRSCQRKPS